MSSNQPVRELWMELSLFTSTTGAAIDLTPFAGPVTAFVLAKSGVGAARTVTFQVTTEDPATPGSPLSSGWANTKSGGFCDAEVDMSIVVDPAVEPYLTANKIVKGDTIRDPAHFVRPILSGADASILGVLFVGKARDLAVV